MAIVNTISLESNKQIKINFNGGDLSSDAGLLLIKEFASKIGLLHLVKKFLKTTDHTKVRLHTDSDNLLQMLYQIMPTGSVRPFFRSKHLLSAKRVTILFDNTDQDDF